MKKIALWCCGMFFAAGTLFAAPAQMSLEQAAAKYRASQVDGFCVGLRLRGINVTPAQKQQISKLSEKFIRTTVIPVLTKHRLQETWIKSIADSELEALRAKTLTMNDEKELRETIQEIIKLMQKKYPILIDTVFADPEYQAGFQRLIVELRTTLKITEKK